MQSVSGLYVYSYHHDDDQQGWIAADVFKYPSHNFDPMLEGGEDDEESLSPEFIEKLRGTLSVCGWEGDGNLGAMMVPPFFSDESDGYWFPVFHVKQGNNGTSWIASERPLSTENLSPESPRVRTSRK